MNLHPDHERFVRTSSQNSLNYFFRLLDSLDPKLRDAVMLATFMELVHPAFAAPISKHQRTGEMMEEPVNYNRFKEKMEELASFVSEPFLVQAAVHSSLAAVLNRSDETEIESVVGWNKKKVQQLTVRLLEVTDDGERESLEKMIGMLQGDSRQLRSRSNGKPRAIPAILRSRGSWLARSTSAKFPTTC
jgi:hypothetical protein